MLGSSVARRLLSTSASGGKVGFIGLGNMGAHMASNLLKAGNEVVVLDVMPESVKKLESIGATSSSTPAELASQCSTVITMLPKTEHVQHVYNDPSTGLLANAMPNTLFIDSSTIDPNGSREIAAKVTAAQGVFVDAPVSGGVGGAEAGTLTFMVGGSDDSFSRASDILSQMGKNLVHCGDVGTGGVAKLCNNLVLAVSMVGVAEAMNLGANLGIDPKVLADIMNSSTARCWSSDTYNPYPGVMEGVPASRGYEGGFGSALMQKDLSLVLDAARSVNQPLPLGASAHQLYTMMSTHGAGHKDFGAVIELLKGDHNAK